MTHVRCNYSLFILYSLKIFVACIEIKEYRNNEQDELEQCLPYVTCNPTRNNHNGCVISCVRYESRSYLGRSPHSFIPGQQYNDLTWIARTGLVAKTDVH